MSDLVLEGGAMSEMTESERLDALAFDEQFALVKAALLKRKTPAAAFEVRT